ETRAVLWPRSDGRQAPVLLPLRSALRRCLRDQSSAVPPRGPPPARRGPRRGLSPTGVPRHREDLLPRGLAAPPGAHDGGRGRGPLPVASSVLVGGVCSRGTPPVGRSLRRALPGVVRSSRARASARRRAGGGGAQRRARFLGDRLHGARHTRRRRAPAPPYLHGHLPGP